MQVSVHAAKTNLSKLIEAVLAGEEVVITRGRKPVAKLVAMPKREFKFDLLAGKVNAPDLDFFKPLDEEELALWEKAP